MAPEGRVIANDPKDEALAAVIETATKLARRRRTIKLFGFEIAIDLNVNTILSIVTLIGLLGTAGCSVYAYVTTPLRNSARLDDLQGEIGKPGEPAYLPGVVRGMAHRMDRVEQMVKQNHDDTLQALRDIEGALKDQRRENADRFDRLDTRIDRLVETRKRTPDPH